MLKENLNWQQREDNPFMRIRPLVRRVEQLQILCNLASQREMGTNVKSKLPSFVKTATCSTIPDSQRIDFVDLCDSPNMNMRQGERSKRAKTDFEICDSKVSVVDLTENVAENQGRTQDVKFLTWNIWFGPLVMEQRMRAIGKYVVNTNADVIAFQEVTEYSRYLLSQQQWWRAYEEVVAAGHNPMYYELLLLKKDTCRILKRSSLALKSEMGRSIVATEVKIGQQRYVLATSHLESPCKDARGKFQFYSKTRKEQLVQSQNFLEKINANSDGECALVWMGDFNWDEKKDGQILDGSHMKGWKDVWNVLKPGDTGYTYDSVANGCLSGGLRRRLDRCLVRIPETSHIELAAVDIIGNRPIVPKIPFDIRISKGKTKQQEVFPSDHFGLLTSFKSVAK